MIIDGKKIADEITESLKFKVSGLACRQAGLKRKPRLAIVLVGQDRQSKIYVGLKVKKAQELGIEVQVVEKVEKIKDWADGIIVQLPGPQEMVDQIPLEKDVDGLRDGSPYVPATVKAVAVILGSVATPESDSGQARMTFCVVGQGKIGKPIADYFAKTNVVVRCDEFTKDLKAETLRADVLVSATGVKNLITKDMVKPGALVIDVGKDVDFENVKDVAGAITPPIGGVGPLTVACLFENLVEAVKIRSSHTSGA